MEEKAKSGKHRVKKSNAEDNQRFALCAMRIAPSAKGKVQGDKSRIGSRLGSGNCPKRLPSYEVGDSLEIRIVSGNVP